MPASKTDPFSIAALLQQLVIAVASQLPILNLIFAKPVAVENQPYEISNAVKGIQALAEDGTVGFAALEALMVASFNTLATDIGQTALRAVQPTWWNTPPSWWSAPPPDYGAPPTVADIWLYPIGSQGYIAQSLLGAAGSYAIVLGQNASIPEARGSLIAFEGDLNDVNHPPPADGPIVVNPQHILSTDDRLSWLTREYPNVPHGWTYDSFSDTYSFVDSAGHQNWRCLVTQEWFLRLQRIAVSGAVAQSSLAPVWPGIAGVTLGAPVALSPTCVVTGPMHGVIIEITSAAPRQVYQVFGGMQGYRFVGGLQFVDDNGEAERIQSIGMQHEVILCKSMAVAASCSIRTDSAVTGTATPFVLT